MAVAPYDSLTKIEGIQAVNGPASINATLLNGVTSAIFEGIWVPWLFVKQGSLEISGSFASLGCQLVGTNALNPVNSYVFTIGGSATNNDVINITFAIPGASLLATTTVVTSETVTAMAAALAAFINTSAAFAAYGFQATNLAGVLTVTWPNTFPTSGVYSTSQPPVSPIVIPTTAVSGAATETVTTAAGVGGSNIGASITAAGMTQFTISSRWLKVRVTALTGGGANVTAIAQGTA